MAGTRRGTTVESVRRVPTGVIPHTRLLDLFEVAEDPITYKAAVIYVDTTLNTYTPPGGSPQQLPEIVLAFED